MGGQKTPSIKFLKIPVTTPSISQFIRKSCEITLNFSFCNHYRSFSRIDQWSDFGTVVPLFDGVPHGNTTARGPVRHLGPGRGAVVRTGCIIGIPLCHSLITTTVILG